MAYHGRFSLIVVCFLLRQTFAQETSAWSGSTTPSNNPITEAISPKLTTAVANFSTSEGVTASGFPNFEALLGHCNDDAIKKIENKQAKQSIQDCCVMVLVGDCVRSLCSQPANTHLFYCAREQLEAKLIARTAKDCIPHGLNLTVGYCQGLLPKSPLSTELIIGVGVGIVVVLVLVGLICCTVMARRGGKKHKKRESRSTRANEEKKPLEMMPDSAVSGVSGAGSSAASSAAESSVAGSSMAGSSAASSGVSGASSTGASSSSAADSSSANSSSTVSSNAPVLSDAAKVAPTPPIGPIAGAKPLKTSATNVSIKPVARGKSMNLKEQQVKLRATLSLSKLKKTNTSDGGKQRSLSSIRRALR